MTSYPYRCTGCNAIRYSSKITEEPTQCCIGNKFFKLVNICLLIPCPPGKTPVHKSRKSPGIVDHETEWVLACGKISLPSHYTSEPSACTCKGCKEYSDKLMESLGWDDEDEEDDLQLDYITVELEEPPPNPFTETQTPKDAKVSRE